MKAPLKVVFSMVYFAATILATMAAAIGKVRFTGTVTKVTVIPNAILTGANTNTRKYELINKGQSGSGTTVIASLQMNSGVSFAAFDEKTITLSVVANAVNVVAGDILALVSTAVGDGIADTGGGVCIVEIERTV